MTKFRPGYTNFGLWVLLVRTRDTLCKARQKELEPYNIQLRQAAVLHALDSIGEKATAAQISRFLGRESHSVSELLNRMEKKGLVRRVRNLDQKNWRRVVLTEKGREFYIQAEKRETVENIMSSLTAEECEQLRILLQKVWDAAYEEVAKFDKKPYSYSK